jgi:hypothetical protein
MNLHDLIRHVFTDVSNRRRQNNRNHLAYLWCAGGTVRTPKNEAIGYMGHMLSFPQHVGHVYCI